MLATKEKYKSRFLIKSGNSYSYLKTDDIKYIFSEDGLSFAVRHDDSKCLLDKPLDRIESSLNPNSFIESIENLLLRLTRSKRFINILIID